MGSRGGAGLQGAVESAEGVDSGRCESLYLIGAGDGAGDDQAAGGGGADQVERVGVGGAVGEEVEAGAARGLGSPAVIGDAVRVSGEAGGVPQAFPAKGR